MKDFLKYVLANFVAMAIVGGACCILFILFLSAMMMSGKKVVQVPAKSILVFNMSMPIVDKPATEDFNTLMANVQGRPVHVMSLHEVLQSFDAAITDDRITALYITGNVMSTSWPNLLEIRQAIQRFKEAGKPVLAYGQFFREVDYYLVSCADQIFMHPNGIMEFNGLASEMMFWKNAFDKYGIDVQVTRVGKYKSAVEPYLQDKMSAANREQITGLLNDLFNNFLTTVATDRKLDAEDLRVLADGNVLLQPQAAVEAGLLDGVEHYDQVLDRLGEHVGGNKGYRFNKQISLRKYAESRELEGFEEHSAERVAVIYAEGQIVNGHSRDDVGGDDIAALLRRARLDENVKAVVLRVNSPGGAVTGSEVIGREARLLAEKKPLVISMGGLAASGGYWISTHAKEIFAQPNTVTGSIGVFGMFANFKGLMNDHGLTVDVAKTSNMADSLTAFRPKTAEELASIQTMIDQAYESFLDLVSEGRKLDREKVQEIAQGRVWSGVKAHELGLVDTLGGLNDAVKAAAGHADLDKYQWYQYQRPKKFAEELAEILADNEFYIEAQTPGPMQKTMANLQDTLKTLSLFDQPQGSYALMPFSLKFN